MIFFNSLFSVFIKALGVILSGSENLKFWNKNAGEVVKSLKSIL